MTKRDLFAELTEGFDVPAADREKKVTLKRVTVEAKPPPKVTAQEVVRVRTKLNVSRVYLRVTSVPTPGRLRTGSKAKPNAQAALLIRYGEKHPEIVQELATLAFIPT